MTNPDLKPGGNNELIDVKQRLRGFAQPVDAKLG